MTFVVVVAIVAVGTAALIGFRRMLGRMATAEPSAECSYAELAQIVDENCEPFDSVAQTKRFLKAASMLRRREPSEMELGGERISRRDLLDMIQEARKALEVLEINESASGRRVPVVVPADCLR